MKCPECEDGYWYDASHGSDRRCQNCNATGQIPGPISNPDPPAKPKALVLLSGGLDSATVLAMALAEGYDCEVLSFQYGQRHLCEISAARRVTERQLGADATWHLINLRDTFEEIGGSALTDQRIAVPENRSAAEIGTGVPSTYVPGRNIIFLSVAAGLAQARNISHIFIGANAVDYSGYPDCRLDFIRAMEAALIRGMPSPTVLRAPIINMSKTDIIREGLRLGVDYSLTRSCYQLSPAGRSCGRCDSCKIRLAAFKELGMVDPVPYC